MREPFDAEYHDPEGAALLNAVSDYLGRFVAYPSDDAKVAHVLWVAHAHLMDAWESTPRLAFLSPEPGSGKTRALEITETLVPRPVEAVNATAAYLFRKVSDPDGLPTILFDEIDTIFGPKAKENEDIRGILNAGHRRGAMAGRCVVKGKTVETEELPAYCAVAVAGLGNLPDTILTRSVVVKMRRRAPNERVESYRRRLHAPEGNALRDNLAAWAETVVDEVSGAWPEMPDGIEDRSADVWEPLLAVADAAGGAWPEKARVAGVALVADSSGGQPSLGIRLLADLKTVFGDQDALATEVILSRLHDMDEAPWGDLKGKPLDARALARLLKPYDVESKVVRDGDRTPRGYTRESLWDAWARYLPDPKCCGLEDSTTTDLKEINKPSNMVNGSLGSPPETSATSATDATDLIDAARADTDLTHAEARELLRHDLDDLVAGRLTMDAARHYLRHMEAHQR